MNLGTVVIILLIYANDIVLITIIPSNLDEQLWNLKNLHSSIGMCVNTNKNKVMIIKSKKDTYVNFFYDNRVDAQSWTPLKTLQVPHNTEKNPEPMALGDNQGYFPNVLKDEVKRQKVGN